MQKPIPLSFEECRLELRVYNLVLQVQELEMVGTWALAQWGLGLIPVCNILVLGLEGPWICFAVEDTYGA